MKVAVYSAKSYDRQFLEEANRGLHELRYLECRLSQSAAALAHGASAAQPMAELARAIVNVTVPVLRKQCATLRTGCEP